MNNTQTNYANVLCMAEYYRDKLICRVENAKKHGINLIYIDELPKNITKEALSKFPKISDRIKVYDNMIKDAKNKLSINNQIGTITRFDLTSYGTKEEAKKYGVDSYVE